MIAALVIFALAATAQVQAFPGSNPISEVLTVVPKHGLVGDEASSPRCFLPAFIDRAQEVVVQILHHLQQDPTQVVAIINLISPLNKDLVACKTGSGLDVTCALQTTSKWWQAAQPIPDEVLLVIQPAVSLVEEFKETCFGNGLPIFEVLTVVPKHGLVGDGASNPRCFLADFVDRAQEVLVKILHHLQQDSTQVVAIINLISPLNKDLVACKTGSGLDVTCALQTIAKWWQAAQPIPDELLSVIQPAVSLVKEFEEVCLGNGL